MLALFVVGGGATAFILVRTLTWTHGHIAYTLDDPEIHLAVARNLVRHGTWGVSPGVYESASSSPLWTLLLAPFVWVFGSHSQPVPFVLNLIAAAWLLYRFSAIAIVNVRRDYGGWLLLALLPVIVLYLPTLAFIGMEHTLHAVITLETLLLLDALGRDGYTSRRLGILAALLAIGTATRLEGAFVAGGCVAAFVLVFGRRFVGDTAAQWPVARRTRAAAVAAVAGLTPFVAVGAVNIAFGQTFLPNSVVAKTALSGTSGYLPSFSEFAKRVHADAFVTFCLVVALGYLVAVWYGRAHGHAPFAIAFAVTVVLHFVFADMGWYARYQEYMVIAGAYLLLSLAVEHLRLEWRNVVFVGLAIAIVLMSTPRAALTRRTALSNSNTYRQPYQIGRFLGHYYGGRAIAINDLGYSAWFHDGPVVDFVGLGTHEVIDQREHGGLNPQFLRKLAREHHVAVIVVFRNWYADVLPPEWVAVAGWEPGQRRVFTLGDMTFFAPDQRSAEQLRRNLRQFQPELPAGTHPKFLPARTG
jgi:hypothetical protein